MGRRQRAIGLLLSGAVVLALAAPASSLGDEQGTTTVAPASPETPAVSPPGEATTTTTVPPPAPAVETPAPQAPASASPEGVAQPAVQGQQAQGSTRSAPAHVRGPQGAKSNEPRKGTTGQTAGGSEAKAPKGGRRAPSPSAFTPALPFALSGSLGRHPGLLHRKLPRAAVSAADLSGRRQRLRDSLAGARGDQRGGDRLRSRPQRLECGRGGVDAVPADRVGAVRRRRDGQRLQGPVQPDGRDLRRGSLPARGGRRHEHSRRGLLLQPLPGLRDLRAAARRASRGDACPSCWAR